MYLCGHRYYDPQAGRWLNRDPIGISGGINIYGYCSGGPVGWVDPSGLVTMLEIGQFIDNHLLGGAVAKFGSDMGNPCTSGWQIAMDAGNLGLQLGLQGLAFADGAGEAELGVVAGEAAIKGAAEGAVKDVGEEAAEGAAEGAVRWGKRGGPAHRAAVADAEAAFKDAGLKHIAGGSEEERFVKEAGRYPDLWFQDAAGNNEFVQVGQQTAGGLPVMREWNAIGDLVSQGNVTFVPYNL